MRNPAIRRGTLRLSLAWGFALILLAGSFLTGCGEGNPMVGVWKLQAGPKATDSSKMLVDSLKATITFTGAGKYSAEMEVLGQKRTLAGSYKLEGKTLTMTQELEDGKPSKNNRVETATLGEDMKSFDFPGANGEVLAVKQSA